MKAAATNDNIYQVFKTSAGGIRTTFGFDVVSNSDLKLINEEVGDIRFGTSGTVRVTFDENGNVGIGTTTPTAKLHINTTDNSTTPLQIQGLNATGQQVTLLSTQNVTGNTTSLTDFCISGGKCLSGSDIFWSRDRP